MLLISCRVKDSFSLNNIRQERFVSDNAVQGHTRRSATMTKRLDNAKNHMEPSATQTEGRNCV